MSVELQIVELAQQGATAAEIATDLGMEQAAVEFTLQRHGLIKDEEISNDDFDEIKRGLVDLAKYSKNEFVKAKVGIFLYERVKGPSSSLKGAPAVNIGNLNLLIAASHQKIINALGGTNGSNSGRLERDSQNTPGPEQGILPAAVECETVPAAAGTKSG